MEKNHKHHQKFEFSKITDLIYVGTNLCCTTRSHIRILLDEGIHAEIDLEKERQDSPPKISVYLWLPVKDKMAPHLGQIDVGVATIDKVTGRGQKIYVHCRNGHGRAPTLAAAYFVFQGMGVDEAVEKVKEKRPEIHLEKNQLKALEDYKSRLNE